MLNKIKRKNDISSICFYASFWPALILVLISVAISTLFFKYHIEGIYEKEINRHELIHQLTSKAIISNIIIDNKNARTITLNEFKSRYSLDNISIADQSLANIGLIDFLITNKVSTAWEIPQLRPIKYILIESKVNRNQVLMPSITSLGIILLFILASVSMHRRIKSRLNDKIVKPLGDTLNSTGEEFSWFDKNMAATEIVELYHRTNDFIKTLHQQRDDLELHKIEQAKYHMALQVAHDIRSPVLAMETIASVCSELKEESKALLNNITRRISQIADDILTEYRPLSNISSSETLSVAEIFTNIINEKKTACINRGIVFEVMLDKKSNHTYLSIPEYILSRVLSNLLNNSIESITDIGTIEISTKTVNENYLIMIEDTGCGIPVDYVNHVFDRGVSLNKINGSGLGLSFVKQTIEKFGGTLQMNSIQNKGTSISIIIPL